MDGKTAAAMVGEERKYLNNILKDFTEENADYAPADGMMTVAQQVRHIAQTIGWFREGAFGEGFDTDFEAHQTEIRKPTTLAQSLDTLNAAYDDWIAFLEGLTEADLNAPMEKNEFFGTAPKAAVVTSCMDHTAHHRGALSVYLRMLSVTPTLVYA